MSTVLTQALPPAGERNLPAAARTSSRLDSLDAWRGLIIVLMVLDHVRDFLHVGVLAYDATDPGTTNLVLYLTRWVTHLCAPTFIFLAGISIRLQREKAGSVGGLSRFLLARGPWLILLEFTVIGFGLNMGGPFFLVQVMYAIGMSMTLMAGLVRLPARAVLGLGFLLVWVAPALSTATAGATGALGVLVTMTVTPGPVPNGLGVLLYPFVPWLGVMCLGYGYGAVFQLERKRRNRIVAATAVLLLLAFGVVRGLNGYGDPAPWRHWPTLVQTVESFFNVTKYPASPAYLMVTLGLSMLLFLLLDAAGNTVRLLLTFGRTPLFTYIVHIYVVHGTQVVIGLLLGYPFISMTGYISQVAARMEGRTAPLLAAGFGLPMWGVYVVWILVIAALFPLSRWFEGVKRRRNEWWIRFL